MKCINAYHPQSPNRRPKVYHPFVTFHSSSHTSFIINHIIHISSDSCDVMCSKLLLRCVARQRRNVLLFRIFSLQFKTFTYKFMYSNMF